MAIMEYPGLQGDDMQLAALFLPLPFGVLEDPEPLRIAIGTHMRIVARDADLVLMDDPMRGVDVGTKREVYELIREEARTGRTFLWYTTETDELRNCDRVYVFRNGLIVADLDRAELTEEKVIQSSFAEAG